MRIEELREKIESGEIQIEAAPTIEVGQLCKPDGAGAECTVRYGWNLLSAKECSDLWARSQIDLLEYIKAQNFDEQQLREVLDSIQVEDAHWDWFAKSCTFTGEGYHWFYLYAEGKPQAACLIFQPKESKLSAHNIFYVEFLAVAPWNRECLVRGREFLGVGTELLRAVLRYAVNELKLSYGFSLHSLPQASGYYQKLKMVPLKEEDKGSLEYFELPSAEAQNLLRVS